MVLGLRGRLGERGQYVPVVAGADLAQLVRPHTFHRLVVSRLIVLDGDLGRHAAHGMYAALVASLDEELNVGVHEGDGHGNSAAVR